MYHFHFCRNTFYFFYFFQSVLANGSFSTTYLDHYEKYIYSDNNNNNTCTLILYSFINLCCIYLFIYNYNNDKIVIISSF